MASLFNRLKVWTGLEIIQTSDLNGELDNILNNLGPSGISGWSSSISQMQIQTSPGTFGAESLATSLNGEIERLRYQINAIIGGPDNVWYDPVSQSLSAVTKSLGNVSGSDYPNRLISGAVVSTSEKSNFLYPAGSTNSVILKATTTPFIYSINGTQYTVSADTTLTGLTKAPASANTATLNDSLQAGADITKITGEGKSYLRLSSVGSNIISTGPYLQAFKIIDGSNTEYFIGWTYTLNSGVSPTSVFPKGSWYITVSSSASLQVGQLITDSTTSGNIASGTYITSINGLVIGLSTPTAGASGSPDTLNVASNTGLIQRGYRGYFYNNSGAQIPRITINNSDTITVMQITWVFINTAGTLIGSTIQPRYDGNTPISGTTNQYWYDINNQTWKQYNGVSWVVANVTLIGMAISDQNNTIGARSFDFYASYSSQASVRLITQDINTITNESPYSEVSVNGNIFQYTHDDLQWVKSNDVESGQSLAANGNAYLYITELGHSIISPIYPYDRTYDLRGWYHPYNSWRCVGYAILDSTPNFQFGVGSDYNTLVRTYSQIVDKNLSYGSVGTHELADFSITAAKLANPKILISNSSSNYATSSTSTVTALSTTAVTYGKPVYLSFQSDNNGSNSAFIGTSTTVGSGVNYVIKRDGVAIGMTYTAIAQASPGSLNMVDYNCPAGTHVYTVGTTSNAGDLAYFYYTQMLVREQ